MVIDFHTHTFPDKIAEKSVAHLAQIGKMKPCTDGRRSSLLQSMQQSGVDISLVLPVATHPKQERTINALSAQISGQDNIFYAGAVHPDCPCVEETLDFIRDSGLRVVKLHPDYQGTDFDDPRYVNILREAGRRGLYVVTHAGIDVAYRDHVHCTPDMILRVLGQLGGCMDNRLILAHMGGYELPDEVLQKLCGLPVYMDTAAVLSLYPDKCAEIIRKHGADRVLFATDSPWRAQKEYIDLLNQMPLTDGEKEKILWKNAAEILQINTKG